MRYHGLLYRALNPIRAREPLSGEGARIHGGRFNPKGVAALYTSMSIITAIKEANQVGTLQPTTLVAYHADVAEVFDGTDAASLAEYDLTPADLAANDWRIRMREDGRAPTQRFAERLIADGYVGLKIRSFVQGATTDDINLVLWSWGSELPTRLLVNDDEGRLR